MAYVDQAKKSKIQAALKSVMPKSWKWSLAVRHHSTIVLTISSAPVDLIAMWVEGANSGFRHYKVEQRPDHVQVNGELSSLFSGELLETFTKIKKALDTDNFDESDSMTDYFHVGHYVDIQLGKWNKPFVVN